MCSSDPARFCYSAWYASAYYLNGGLLRRCLYAKYLPLHSRSFVQKPSFKSSKVIMAKDQHPESLVDAEDVQNSVKTIVEPADILPSVEPVGLNSLVRDVRLVPFTISSSAFEETTGTETYPREATKKESETLRHVADKVPVSAWIVAITGAAAQFSYYGVSVPWRKILQFPSW